MDATAVEGETVSRVSWIGGFVMVATGCGGSSPRTVSPATLEHSLVRVAVLPVAWATPTVPVEINTSRLLLESVTARGVEAIEATAESGCATDSVCVRNAGAIAHADKVLALQLAALGTTVLLRASLIDVASGTQEQTVQRVVTDATGPSLEQAIVALGSEMIRPLIPAEPTPGDRQETDWYEEWWVWTIAGVAVAAGVVGTVLLTNGTTEQPPDVIITPPGD